MSFVLLHYTLVSIGASDLGVAIPSYRVEYPVFLRLADSFLLSSCFSFLFYSKNLENWAKKPRACWAPRPKGAAEAAWHGGACANCGAHLAVGMRATWGCPLLKVRHTSMDRHTSVDRQRKLLPGLAFSLAVRAAGHARHAAGAHLGAVERHLAVHRLVEGSHVLGLRRGVGGG